MKNKQVALAICILALAILACAGPGWVSTATPDPETRPAALAIPRATATKLPTEVTELPTQTPWTAYVQAEAVYVRSEPDGLPTDKFLTVGNSVTVLQCVGNWCQIKEPAGWVFRGCLSDNPTGLGCEAK